MGEDRIESSRETGEDCCSCGEGMPREECPKSLRPCGHHCNHSWSHDSCCWCGEEWDGEEGAE